MATLYSRNPARDRGFTLIELLVVIAIIGVLSSIVLASLAGARQKAYEARALSESHAMSTALQLYHDDTNTWPHAGLGGFTSDYITEWPALMDDLRPYLPQGIAPPGSTRYRYMYAASSIGLTPANVGIMDNPTGYYACILVTDGYWTDFMTFQQTPATLRDGGIDPRGLESFNGAYVMHFTRAECQNPGI